MVEYHLLVSGTVVVVVSVGPVVVAGMIMIVTNDVGHAVHPTNGMVVAGGIADLDIEDVIDVGRLLKFPNICRTAYYCYNPTSCFAT
jgi:hypothetical protein